MSHATRLHSVRPLVRYVDDEQAIIEAHFSTLPTLTGDAPQPPCRSVDVFLEVDADDGFHDEGHTRLQLHDHHGSVRFEIIRPDRWWPAGMGRQALYRLSITVVDPGYGHDEKQVVFGLTSVRRDRVLGDDFEPSLLVNGQICDIDSVVVIDRINENKLLPIHGDSLLLVRDHFGPELLYDAADRAGILMIQCVPIDPDAQVESAVVEQVARLSSHPSLAGYFVGHLGALSDRVAETLSQVDPTRPVFRRFPLDGAA